MSRFLPHLLCCIASLGIAAEPITPNTPGWFPFTISTHDATATPIDLTWLNEMPAGKSGFLRAEGERIVNNKGETVRLFGTNFCGAACFQEEAIAKSIAAHLAKNGINVVRLHHMDNGWGDSIIEDNEANKLSADKLAKLDRLIAEFIAKGIYVNLNLHVSRTYSGTPEGAPSYSKGLDHFHPPFIERFKDYARQLLNHVNPHTGRAYKDEPGIAVVEMNNENSLVLNPWWVNALPAPFSSELRELFVKHLRKTYASTEALRQSWGVNDGHTGANLITNGDFAAMTKGWGVEHNNGAKGGFEALAAGAKGIRWTTTQSGSVAWSIQLSQPGLRFDEKTGYRLKFRARSAQAATIAVNAQNSAPPWANLGLQEQVTLTPDWKDYSLDFMPHNTLPDGQNRIAFGLLNKVTSIDLADVSLCSVPSGFLKPEQTFEASNIPLAERGSNAAVKKDFFAFLIDLEVEHALGMKAFIRDEIGAKQMITHSQVLFGGIVGARREWLVSDMVDTHGYWHHPSFPHKSWDMGDWEINNVSQLADEAGGTLAEMAMQRPAGKPYSVSEYDTPAPNDYAAETFPLFAAMACLQDWSALYHFNFKNAAKLESDRITSFFDLPGHPGKQAFMPLAALVFRKGLIAEMHTPTSLDVGDGSILDYVAQKSGDVWGSWRDLWATPGLANGNPPLTGAEAWKHRVDMGLSNKAEPIGKGDRHLVILGHGDIAKPKHSDDGRLVRDTQLPWLHLNGDGAQVWSGKLTASPASAGKAPVSVQATGPEANATVMLAALDGAPLATSKKLWLCALNRAENPGMGWDAERRSLGKAWGTGPALVLGVQAKVDLPGEAADWKVEALDAMGTVKSIVAEKATGFEIKAEQKTVWWLITR